MFPNFGEQETQKPKQRTIHFIQNGYPQKLFTHTFTKTLNKSDIQSICDVQWPTGKQKPLRFFTLEGVQIEEEDLSYVRNGDRIYVSRDMNLTQIGQDFDSSRNFGQYKLVRQLGEGGFGKVWLAQSIISKQMAALKLLKLQKITGARDIDMVFRQIENLKALSHPNIVKIINCYTLANMQLVVVMEYLSGGQLFSLLKEKGQFDQLIARGFFQQIVSAVDYCHGKNIVHRDLKLQNILLVNKNDLRVKVADFGISGVADSFNPDFDIGTLKYMAPQVLSRKEKVNTGGVDIWAMGVMLFSMLYGELPFNGTNNSQIIQSIISGKFAFPSHPMISQDCKDIINRMLTVDPKNRIQIGELQNHPWMVNPIVVIKQEQKQFEKPVLQKVGQKDAKRIKQLKKSAIIPKRLQKQKQQLEEKLLNLGVSKRKMHLSEVKPQFQDLLSPRYMQPIKCKDQQDRKAKKKRSSVSHGMWK